MIDGSNAAFAYREGDGRWRAEGPLLAIQVRAWVGACLDRLCVWERDGAVVVLCICVFVCFVVLEPVVALVVRA